MIGVSKEQVPLVTPYCVASRHEAYILYVSKYPEPGSL